MSQTSRQWRGNFSKMISLSEETWSQMRSFNLINIPVTDNGNRLIDETGHEFMNLVSCDYLGILNLKSVREESIRIIKSHERVNLSASSVRIISQLQKSTEEDFEKLFDVNCLVTLSASEASSALLPLLASGYFHKGQKPVMVYDKEAHFSLKYTAPMCCYQTEVLEINKDDMIALEQICKQHENVVYVTDSVYSLGGKSEILTIKSLQEKYNLYVCFDEAHSLSIFGDKGEGLVRPIYNELPDNIFILASLNKAFGASGGVIFMSKNHDKEMIRAVGGPLGWSQSINDYSLAAINASLSVHKSGQVKELQKQLRNNISYFDSKANTPQKGSLAPIRIIEKRSLEETIACAKKLYTEGYYLAPIFFPIVKQGFFGLRLMIRSDISRQDIENILKFII